MPPVRRPIWTAATARDLRGAIATRVPVSARRGRMPTHPLGTLAPRSSEDGSNVTDVAVTLGPDDTTGGPLPSSRMEPVPAASTFDDVPSDEQQGWREFAMVNRERIDHLTKDLSELRASVHRYRSEAEAVRYMAQQVADLARHVDELARQVRTLTDRALRRPSQTTAAVAGQYLALIVAIIALVYAATR